MNIYRTAKSFCSPVANAARHAAPIESIPSTSLRPGINLAIRVPTMINPCNQFNKTPRVLRALRLRSHCARRSISRHDRAQLEGFARAMWDPFSRKKLNSFQIINLSRRSPNPSVHNSLNAVIHTVSPFASSIAACKTHSPKSPIFQTKTASIAPFPGQSAQIPPYPSGANRARITSLCHFISRDPVARQHPPAASCLLIDRKSVV
jgi:hypothetical protein